MTGGKKIIGVCLTKVQDGFRNTYLKHLHTAAKANECKLIVFNSILDLYNHDVYDEGAKTVYDVMNYKILDAVILLPETFYDEDVVNSIISKAHEHGKPVLLIHGEREGCSSIVQEYDEPYTEMLCHVINEHNARDTFMIAGNKSLDDESVKRINCYKKALEKCGLQFCEDNLGFGEYWDTPTIAVTEEILKREKLPDAIFCTNDYMAMAVCQKLAQHGVRVPEDIIVTGFDGVERAEYFSPRLTTCKEDIKGLAEKSIDILLKAIDGAPPVADTEDYLPVYSDSCGCSDKSMIDYKKRGAELFRLYKSFEEHESHIYEWADKILECTDINKLSSALKDYILPNSSVCLRNDIILSAMGHNQENQTMSEFVVVNSMTREYKGGVQGRYDIEKMVPDFDEWLEDDDIYILSSIFVRNEMCGFYAAKTEKIDSTGHMLNRLLKLMNIAFTAVLSHARQKKLAKSMENMLYTDPITGVLNLKGATKWFDEFSKKPENHRKTVAMSIYGIPRYSFIYENYGISDIEEVISFVAEGLKLANPENSLVARTADDEFVVVNYIDENEDIGSVIDNATSIFFGVVEGYNTHSEKDYYVEVNCGCTVAFAGWTGTFASFVKLASGEMYLNRMQSGLGEVIKEKHSGKELFNLFNLLVERNLFKYHFQPIVDARSGEIYAYEALMRTGGGISMSPLQVLEIAEEYGRLHDIEKATMVNVIERYAKENDSFKGRKIFINSIPGHFLSPEECEEIREKYGQYFDNLVIELTEQNTASDAELNAINSLRGLSSGIQIAIDDYGTGHSNIVNLLRYSPQVVKIDRFLISNIDKDVNKQMFVKSTIDFARMNGILVLAEGVETSEELRTVINFGVDLIQGYYTAKPAEQPLPALPDNIVSEILDENIRLSKFDNDMLVYYTTPNETVDLVELVAKRYKHISITGGSVHLTGKRNTTAEIIINTADNSVCDITLENVNIKGTNETTVQLGENCKARLNLIGENVLSKEGISVPENSSLDITGDGNLIINCNRNYGVAIGAGYEDPYGEITINSTGKIRIHSSGDKAVGIGGGYCGTDCGIELNSGSISIFATGISAIGLGSSIGKANIFIGKDCYVETRCDGNESVSIGSVKGVANIVSEGELNLLTDGEKTVSIGTAYGSSCSIDLRGKTNVIGHADTLAAIGSITGTADINLDSGHIKVYGEGSKVSGIGSCENKGLTVIRGGNVRVDMLAAQVLYFGSDNNTRVIMGGSVTAGNDNADIGAVNDAGEALHPVYIDGGSYERHIRTAKSSYIYKAELNDDFNKLCVYLPTGADLEL